MNVEFIGEPEDVSHEEAVSWAATVDGRLVRCHFTRNAIRSVMPLSADKRDLRARVASHGEVFARLVTTKLAMIESELPTEVTITEYDVPTGT